MRDIQFNVNSFRQKSSYRRFLKFNIEPEKLALDKDDLRLNEPVSVEATALSGGDLIIVEGDISANFELTCGRCLEKFSYSLQVSFHEEFKKGREESDEEELYYYDGNEISLLQPIRANILLALPLKFVCQDECKGLCQKCGKDLNEDSCDCRIENIDPRMQALEKLRENSQQ